MKTKKTNKNLEEKNSYLAENQAEKLLNQIIVDSQSKQLFGSSLLKNKYFKSALIICGVLLLLLFFLPGTIIPTPISDFASTPAKNSGSATVSFQLNSLIPPREVSARLNDKPITVTQESYLGYSINVHENGYLLLEVETVTGKTSSTNFLIDNLDDEAPQIVKHEDSSEGVTLYITDNDTGVDYSKIKAYNPETSKPVPLLSFSETDGYIVLGYPTSAIYVEIPDNAGNKITYILKPIKTNQPT